MKTNNKLIPIADLGEFALIDRLTSNFKVLDKNLIKGVGDDAAVFLDSENSETCTLITTDLLVEGVHFNLIYTPLKHLGYKAVVVNLSDLYAMNAIPKYITISLAVSNKFSVEALEALYSGVKLACERFDVELIGGDTSSSLSGLFINISAIGKADKNKIVYRSGAKKNDLICVTGDLGAAYLGLQLLEREKEIYLSDPLIQPEISEYKYIIERQLKPEPRRDIIKQLDKYKIRPSSMIDVSDGLSSELLHLCKNSNLGCKVFEEQIPIHEESMRAADMFGINHIIAAMNGGEDYELLFTVPLELQNVIEKINDIAIIGYMVEDINQKCLVTKDGTEIEIKAQGWNHSNL